MSSIVEAIQSAIANGTTISIVYNGGSRPGQARLVIPISLTSDLISDEAQQAHAVSQ